MSRLAQRRGEGQVDQSLRHSRRNRRLAGLAGLVARQPVGPGLHKAPLHTPHRGLQHVCMAHNLSRATASGRDQDDPYPPQMRPSAVPIGQNELQPLPITRLELDLCIPPHAHMIRVMPRQEHQMLHSRHYDP